MRFLVRLAVLDGGIGGGGLRCSVEELVSLVNVGVRRFNVEVSLDVADW